ncbi:hypothetical protein YC2023_030460 [Brassica napus]
MMGTIITRRRTSLNNHPNLIIAIMAHLQPEEETEASSTHVGFCLCKECP